MKAFSAFLRRARTPRALGALGLGVLFLGAGIGCFVELDPPASADAGEASLVDAADGAAAGDAGCNDGQGFARVQAAHANTLTGKTDHISVTLDAAQNAGDVLVVGVNSVACTGVQAVADTAGNTYRRFVGADALGDAGSLETWGAPNIAAAASGANTVTVTFGGVCPAMNMKVVEYGGVDPVSPVDTTASTHGAGGTPMASLVVPSSELLFAHTADSYVAVGPGAGWTQILEDEWRTIAQEQIARTAGTYAVTFQPSSGEGWVIQAVALRCR